jgi:hypothetical protein
MVAASSSSIAGVQNAEKWRLFGFCAFFNLFTIIVGIKINWLK